MSVAANLKCDFAELKYEQLLTEKYFIETCFSKKYDSYPAKERLQDMLLKIRANDVFPLSKTTEVEEIDCETTTTTTTTTSTTTTSSTTTTTTIA